MGNGREQESTEQEKFAWGGGRLAGGEGKVGDWRGDSRLRKKMGIVRGSWQQEVGGVRAGGEMRGGGEVGGKRMGDWE